jgi:hypothetical protein
MGYNEPKKALDFSVHFGKSSSVGQVDWAESKTGGSPGDQWNLELQLMCALEFNACSCIVQMN